MDLTDTIIPKSDQLNAEDLIAGPRTFTITDVRAGGDEQPVNIHLAENPGRPFRPSKTVRRILVAAWGKDGDAYVGRRLTLYRDPAVKWAGQEIGGIRVSHLSHIDKPMKLALAVTKGKREAYTVQPLKDEPKPKVQPGPALDVLIENAQEARTNDELSEVARQAVASLKGDDLEAVKAVVTARRAELAEQ
jgi:hypothetical protein